MDDQSNHAYLTGGRPTSDIDVDPAALWLCQLPGMTPALALQLIATFGSPDGVACAPSRALRATGAPPVLVGRIVAGARAVPQVAAGLKGLQRLGIAPLPLVSPHYPDRLRALPSPPLVVYAQGAWPIVQPVCLVESSGALEPAVAEAWDTLRAATRPYVAWAGRHESPVESLRLMAVPWGLMAARQRMTQERWRAISSGATTVLSPVAPTTQGGAAELETIAEILIALADAILLLPGAGSERLITLARMLARPVFAIAPPHESVLPAVSRVWGVAAPRRLLRALGIQQGRGATAQQERLF